MSDPGKGKRRLPVLQNNEDEEVTRPASQWIAIGGVGIVVMFLPLAMLAGKMTKGIMAAHLPTDQPEQMVQAYRTLAPAIRLKLSLVMLFVPSVALAVASLCGGAVVGRFGVKTTGKEATLAGLTAGGLVALWSLFRNWPQGGVTTAILVQRLLSLVIVVLIATLMARLGGWLGARLASRGQT